MRMGFRVGMVSVLACFFLQSIASEAGTLELKTGEQIFPSPAATWTFEESPFALKQITETLTERKYLTAPAGIRLRNGKTLDELVPDHEDLKSPNGVLTLCQEFSNLKLRAEQRVSVKNDALQWEVTLNNASTEELWIEIKLDLPAKNQPTDHYWNGFEERAVSATPFLRKEMQDTFPVTLFYGPDHGLAVGVPPSPETSFLQNGLGKDGRMFYTTRFVVFPGKSECITFLLYVVKPMLGARDAVHGYYRRFPAAFEPFPGVDPRLVDGRRTDALQLGHYAGGIKNANQAVMASQWYAGTEWFFTPFYRDGDYVGRKEYWDLQLSVGQQKRMREQTDRGSFDRTDWDRFHKTRIARFRDADLRGNYAPAFFTLNHVEVELAKKLGITDYAYSRTGNGVLKDCNWTLPYTIVYFLYPWATPYESILRRDLPEVVKELNLSVFAHDLYAEQSKGYRGELDYYLPGWSYDEEGKFIGLPIGHRREADFIHALRNNDGRPLGLLVNGGGHLISGFTPDAAISEMRMTEIKNPKVREADINRRLMMGHKPLFQHGYNSGILLGDIVPWESLPPGQCRAVYDDFVRDYLIYLYQAGLTPCFSMSSAFEVIGNELPTLLEVMGRGFEPASACVGNPTLERVRYGAVLGAVVVLSNRSSDLVRTEERFIPKYLGETGVVLPAEYRGGELKFTFDANGTVFPLSVPFMESKLVSFPIALRTNQVLAGSGRCETVIEPVRRTYRIMLELKTPADVLVAVGPNTGFELGSVSCNGKSVTAEDNVPLAAGKNELIVETVSAIARSSMKAFTGFALGDAVITLPAQPKERESAAAQMIQDFVQVRLNKSLALGSAVTDKPVIRIARITSGESRGVTIDGKTMTIRGTDPFDLQQVIWDLLRFLDRHDPRFVPTHNNVVYGGNASTVEMLKKAGLYQQWMRDVKPEKRVPWNEFAKPDRTVAANTVREENLRTITVPYLEQEPKLDGNLNDEIWKKAAAVDGFTLLQTKEKPTQATEAYVFRTADALFVGFKCHEANMNKIMTQMTAFDSDVWEDDVFELRLASGVKGTEAKYAYFVFLVNPIGTMTDLRYENGVQDLKWNSNWKCKVHKDAAFWSGEIRIPLSAMGNSQSPSWRANFSRFEKPNSEYSSWSPLIGANDPAAFGIMKFK